MSRQELLSCLDTLAAQTQRDLDAAETLALEVAAIADQASARLAELAGLRLQIQAASAIAEDARPSPIRRHHPSYRVRAIA